MLSFVDYILKLCKAGRLFISVTKFVRFKAKPYAINNPILKGRGKGALFNSS